jgi:hypothetical protein
MGGKAKDYGLWYWAGQQVLKGGPLYEPVNGIVDFIYPPTSAILLAIPSYFGKVPLYLALSILNSAAWWATGQLSNAMTGSEKFQARGSRRCQDLQPSLSFSRTSLSDSPILCCLR